MKSYLAIVAALVIAVTAAQAQERRLTKEEFQQKQREFISRCAGLTDSESAQFFPLYFELQKKKEDLNGKMWDQMHRGRDAELSDEEYADIIETVARLRVSSDELDLEYIAKFRKFLTAKKIFDIQHAEVRFHRELLREARDRREPKPFK